MKIFFHSIGSFIGNKNKIEEGLIMKNFIYITVVLFVLSNTLTAQTGTDTIQVSTGWNLIGALTTGSIPDIINTDPPGIIETSLWGFNFDSGYYPADTLNKGKGYWVKVNQSGIIIMGFPTNCGTISYDGKIYNTVIIGTQCWFRENLDVGIAVIGGQNQTNNGVIEKYCYDNDPNNCNVYGGLYQWNEAMQYSTTPGTQGVCPPGWHIPTIAELTILSAEVGGDGNSLKAIGQGFGGGAGTNTSGFSALLVGGRVLSGGFANLYALASFWSSTETSTPLANYVDLDDSDSSINLNNIDSKDYGFSVRCLKD